MFLDGEFLVQYTMLTEIITELIPEKSKSVSVLKNDS